MTTLPVGLVVRAIGYRGQRIPGLPFDQMRGVIPSDGGRVTAADRSASGTNVAGWIKRGARGVIGTNRKCAANTAEKLMEDACQGLMPTAETISADEVATQLASRIRHLVSYRDWQAINVHERWLGERAQRPRVKSTKVSDMLEVPDLAASR